MKGTIIIVDNDRDFLDTRAALLELEGFTVHKAASRKEAEDLVHSVFLHAAIIDVRLRDDNDPKDTSGLTLAKSNAYRLIPKIVMTRWPTYEAVREALGPAVEGLPAAVDFVAKQEGPDAMLAALRKVFDNHVRINRNLVIETGSHSSITFAHLVGLIYPGLASESLINRSSELEDLFRRLFYQQNSVRIDRQLWRSQARVALGVFAFSDGRPPEPYVVVCGGNTSVTKETEHYRGFAPPGPGRLATVLTKAAETPRYAANAYVLAGANLEEIVSLRDLYKNASERIFNSALQNLFEHTLAEWHRDKRVVASQTLDQYYVDLLSSSTPEWDAVSLRERVRAILRLAPTIGERLDLSGDLLRVRFGGQVFSYPNPSSALENFPRLAEPSVLMSTPGTLSGENVLADSTGRTWLTDFADAGLAPLLWNFVALETAIRFDWIDSSSLHQLHDIELLLVFGDFNRIDPSDIEHNLRRPLRAIQTLRRLASSVVGKDPLSYHFGVLFQAIKRLSDFDPTSPLMPGELTKLTHVLMTAAMICSQVRISDPPLAIERGERERGVRVDRENHLVWVDGVRISLRGNSYRLLCNLYDKPDHVSTRKELVEKVFEEEYDNSDESQIARLNTAIRRLRERIEEDPDHPRYVITEQGLGYRLVTFVAGEPL